MSVILPWPSPVLSPNARRHWSVVSKAKANYRNTARVLALQAKPIVPAEGLIKVRLCFVPPDSRRRDMDNMIASMKAGLDGFADALKVDDSRFELTFSRGGKDPKGQGYVEIEVLAA